MPGDEIHRGADRPKKRFVTTRWSLVLAAGKPSTPEAREALEVLCRRYWYPLYAYVRRRGFDAVEAQDLTQGFFTRFLEKNYLAEVRRERGKCRSFLLASLNHSLVNDWDREHAKKRFPGEAPLSLDLPGAGEPIGWERKSLFRADCIWTRKRGQQSVSVGSGLSTTPTDPCEELPESE